MGGDENHVNRFLRHFSYHALLGVAFPAKQI